MELEISIEDLLSGGWNQTALNLRLAGTWMIFTVVSVHLRMILIMLAAGTLWLA